MKRTIIIIVLFFFVQTVRAQKGIDNLIQAEKDFAAYSVAHSTKEAFLKVMDSSSIMFDNGKPVKGIEFWNKREKNTSVLNWQPQYAEISASGDFGYTTGPWTFSINDTIKGHGYYITVWHINKKGEWKFLADLGVSSINCDIASLEKIIGEVGPQNKRTEASLRHTEESFIKSYQQNAKLSYASFLSTQSRLYRNRQCAAYGAAQPNWAIDSLPLKIQYAINGSGIAPSGDLGYVYGTTVINSKTENYLRIWRNEVTGWKIAVEVLRY